MWDRPCAECFHCIPFGAGEGLCDYPYKIKDKFIVNLFEIEVDCPFQGRDIRKGHQKGQRNLNREGKSG